MKITVKACAIVLIISLMILCGCDTLGTETTIPTIGGEAEVPSVSAQTQEAASAEPEDTLTSDPITTPTETPTEDLPQTGNTEITLPANSSTPTPEDTEEPTAGITEPVATEPAVTEPTQGVTDTPTSTPTAAPTPTPTPTPTVTHTPTPAVTPTPTPTVTPTPTSTSTPRPTRVDTVAPYCRGKLSKSMQDAYDKMVSALREPSFDNDGKMKIDIDLAVKTTAKADVNKLYGAVLADHPEFFFLNNTISYGTLSDVIKYITVSSSFTNSEIESAKAEIEAGIKYYTDRVSASLSEFEISRKLYELISTRISYDLTAENLRDLYGAVVDRAGVCEAFAELYQYLLGKYGIQSFTVTGDAQNGNGASGAHKWIAVKLEGKWYYSDPTWADLKGKNTVPDGKIKASYAYLNLDAAHMTYHHPDEASLAFLEGLSFNSDAMNYYTVYGGQFDTFDEEALRSYLTQQLKAAVKENRQIVSIRCSKESFESCKQFVSSNIYSIYYGVEGLPSDVSFSSYTNAQQYVLDICLSY